MYLDHPGRLLCCAAVRETIAWVSGQGGQVVTPPGLTEGLVNGEALSPASSNNPAWSECRQRGQGSSSKQSHYSRQLSHDPARVFSVPQRWRHGVPSRSLGHHVREDELHLVGGGEHAQSWICGG
jgi:hypothetical protein